MSRLARLALLFIVCAGVAVTPLQAGSEEQAVERAVLDYVEAIEQARPELIERSVHEGLTKFGFYRQSPEGEARPMPMTFEQLVELSRTFKPNGQVPDDATHSVEVFEVLDMTAAAKLTAFWDSDYLHLAKFDGKWKIVHVLWQSPPAGD